MTVQYNVGFLAAQKFIVHILGRKEISNSEVYYCNVWSLLRSNQINKSSEKFLLMNYRIFWLWKGGHISIQRPSEKQ